MAGKAISGSVGNFSFTNGTVTNSSFNSNPSTTTAAAANGIAAVVLSSPLAITLKPAATSTPVTFCVAAFVNPLGSLSGSVFQPTLTTPYIAISTSSSPTATGSWLASYVGFVAINFLGGQAMHHGVNLTPNTIASGAGDKTFYVHLYMFHQYFVFFGW